MAITKVWIEEDCTACGLCEEICPEVFILKGIAAVIEGDNFAGHDEKIKEDSESCPVEVMLKSISNESASIFSLCNFSRAGFNLVSSRPEMIT